MARSKVNEKITGSNTHVTLALQKQSGSVALLKTIPAATQ